jgi:hypothetical protein
MGSKASPNVRNAFNSDRICAPQRTDAKCQQRSSTRGYEEVDPDYFGG